MVKKKIGGLRAVIAKLQKRGYSVSMKRERRDSLGSRTLRGEKRIGKRVVKVDFDHRRGKLRGHGIGSGFVEGGSHRRVLKASKLRSIRRDRKGRFA